MLAIEGVCQEGGEWFRALDGVFALLQVLLWRWRKIRRRPWEVHIRFLNSSIRRNAPRCV
jgi:uncharacterized NAD(P)/FAD-binding protein YdhS